MATEKEAPKNKGGRPRKFDHSIRNPTLAFRVRGDLYEKIKDVSNKKGLSLSEVIERRMIDSFDMEELIEEKNKTAAALERTIVSLEKMDKVMWPTEEDRVLGRALSLLLHNARTSFDGKSWRENPSVVVTVVDAIRNLMCEFSRDRFGILLAKSYDQERISQATDSASRLIADIIRKDMPPLPPLVVEKDATSLNNRIRTVATFKDRASGKILETVVLSEGGQDDRHFETPEFKAAIEKYRPVRNSIDLETSMVAVLDVDETVWDPQEHKAA